MIHLRQVLLPALASASLLTSLSSVPAIEAQDRHPPIEADAGLAIHVGATDGQFESRLAASGNMLVHGLAVSEENLTRARAEIRKLKNRYGMASVHAVASLERLPYADNIANVVIADLDALGDDAPSISELRRVVVPTGELWTKAKGKWTKQTEPIPAGVDVWQHWDHGADGNPYSTDEHVAPTTSLRWLAGATITDGAGSKVGLRISDGHVYYTAIQYDVARRFRREPNNDVIARDAFNGLLRWKRPIDGVPGGGDQPPRFALTASGGRVYCYPDEGGPLQALDAKTGETLVKFEAGPQAPPVKGWNKWDDRVSKIHYIVRVFDEKVFQASGGTAYLSDAETGKLLWKESFGKDSVIGWAVAADDKVFLAVSDRPLIKNRASHATPADHIIALDVKSGKTLWDYDELTGRALFRVIHFRGSVILPTFSTEGFKPNFGKNLLVVRLNADDGKVVWKSEPKGEGRGHYWIAMGRGDEVFVGQQGGFGLDFETGEMTQKYSWGQVDNSCADLKCVPGYTMYGLTFIDREGQRIHRGQTRTVCDVGLFPAYGLLYGSPLGCLCSEYINGYPAMAHRRQQAADERPRLEHIPHSAFRNPQSQRMADAHGGCPTFLLVARRGFGRPRRTLAAKHRGAARWHHRPRLERQRANRRPGFRPDNRGRKGLRLRARCASLGCSRCEVWKGAVVVYSRCPHRFAADDSAQRSRCDVPVRMPRRLCLLPADVGRGDGLEVSGRGQREVHSCAKPA